ncbi:hypothetical protein [Janthinobacterium lividum]|uniref:hypothetical protein n=1 Tax=Janthinobacterium lividum TaxID=29581 RepID=UPI001CB91A72|nr:hypothetical protein [Janthinobacterium lividum]
MMKKEQHIPVASAAPDEAFQARVQPWMMACFGAEISADGVERNHRFLEESLELVQASGCTASEARQLVDYVFGRPVGERAQEVGGVMVTLAALCLAKGLDMHAAGDTELARIWTKVEAIRAKQAAKPKHSPLPAQRPATAGSMDLDDLMTACESAYRIGPYHGFVGSLNAIRNSAMHKIGMAEAEADECERLSVKMKERAEKAEARVKELEAGTQSLQAEGKHRAPCARSCEAPAFQNQLRERDARIAELEAQLVRRRAPLSAETQQAIAVARAAGQTITATPAGLVFMNDGAEPGTSELGCPACGGSGHAADVDGGSAP